MLSVAFAPSCIGIEPAVNRRAPDVNNMLSCLFSETPVTVRPLQNELERIILFRIESQIGDESPLSKIRESDLPAPFEINVNTMVVSKNTPGFEAEAYRI